MVVLGDIAREYGLKTSLLERLERKYDEIGAVDNLVHLNINYRCHPNITKFLASTVYKYPITSALTSTKEHPKAIKCPIFFYCSHINDDVSCDREVMKVEAKAVVEQVKRFFEKWPDSWKDSTLKDVCIVSSVRTQVPLSVFNIFHSFFCS